MCFEFRLGIVQFHKMGAQLKGGILAYLKVQVASANKFTAWWDSAAGAIPKMVSCTCTVLAFQLNPRRCGFTGSAGL